MKCAAHPEIETSLRCNKCGKPICPKCMVQTPVGARCPDCARLNRLPTFSISTRTYLKALGTGLGTAIICGIIWWMARRWVPFPYLNLLLAPGVGYVVGEIVSRSVNRKRGTGLAVVASLMVVLSYPVSYLLPGRFSLSFMNFMYVDLLGLALGILLAINRMR